MNEQNETVEQEIQRKGLNAPRVTPADIEANIASEFYFTGYEGPYGHAVRAGEPIPSMPDRLHVLTICVLVTRNGSPIIGHSAPAATENFDAEIGRKAARAKAIDAMWPLMGYALREKLSNQDER